VRNRQRSRIDDICGEYSLLDLGNRGNRQSHRVQLVRRTFVATLPQRGSSDYFIFDNLRRSNLFSLRNLTEETIGSALSESRSSEYECNICLRKERQHLEDALAVSLSE
jgi:hypothetical protein